MAATLEEGNFTFAVLLQDQPMISIDVAQPLLKVELSVEEMEQTTPQLVQVYFDLTDSEAPLFYRPFEGDPSAWVVEPASEFVQEIFLSPLMMFNPSIFEDAWFDYDAATGDYVLNLTHIGDAMESSDTEGIESFTVRGDETYMSVEILGYDPETNEPQAMEIRYDNIGTTVVTLPTNIIDPIANFFNTLNLSTNHSYFFDIVENPSTDTERFLFTQYGSRDGETFEVTSYGEEGQGYSSTYYAPLAEGYEQITSLSFDDAVVETIDEAAYQEALEGFYPLHFLLLKYEWLTPATANLVEGARVFDLDPAFYDQILPSDVLPSEAIIDRFNVIVISFFGLTMLELEIGATFEGQTLLATMNVGQFDFVTIERPFIPVDSLNLIDAVSLVQSSSNYFLYQGSTQPVGEFPIFTQHFSAARMGDDYEVYDFPLSPIQYTRQEDVYERYMLDDTGTAQKETISQEEYELSVIQPQWVDLDNLSPTQFLVSETDPNEGELLPEFYDSIIEIDYQSLLADLGVSDIPETLTPNIQAVTLTSTSGFLGQSLTVEIAVEVEGLPLFLEADYDSIGVTDFERYEVIIPLTSEAFLSTYSNGLTHFLGTLSVLENAESEPLDVILFGRDAQTIATIDFMTFTYTALRQLSETEFVQITGSPGSSLTNESPSSSEVYQEALASITYVDFAALTTTMLTEDANNFGSYVLNPADYETILNLPTSEGEVISHVSFRFSLESVLVMVMTTDVNQNQKMYVIEYDEINTTFDIVEILKAINN